MNREKKLSVRMAAVGGAALRQELRAVGMEGDTAMQGVASSANAANVNLEDTSIKAARARDAFEQMSVRAAAGAASIRMQSAAVSDMQNQINRLTGVSPAIGQTTAEFLQQGQALDDLRAKYNPVFGVIRQYKQEVSEIRAAHLEGAFSADEMAAAISRSRQAALASIGAYKGSAQAIQQMSHASRGANMRLQQMFFQVNDIGVSLAGGMNPFVVMAQQGTQIAQIYGFGNGGVGGAFKDIGRLIGGFIKRMPILTAAVAAGSLAVAGLRKEINELGKETVSFGDTAKAVFQVIGGYIYDFIKPAIDMIAPWFSAAWDSVVSGVKWLGNMVINGIRLTVEGIRLALTAIPAYFEAAWESAKMFVYHALADMLNGLGGFLKDAADGINSVFGTSLSAPEGIFNAAGRANRIGNDAAALAQTASNRGAAAFDTFGTRADEIMNSDPMGQFFDDVAKQARENARKRKEKDKKGGSEADEVQKLVDKLQMELKLLRETDPVKAQMIQYSEELAEATAEERKQILDLVVALDQAKHGWEAVSLALGNYAEEAKRIGDDIGQAFTSAFQSAEDAVGEFVKTGKLSFSDLVTSLIADLAKLATRKYILGPLSAGLDAALGGIGGGGGFFSNFAKGFNSYEGGGYTGNGSRSGGLDGKGGFWAVMHPGERVVDEYRGQRGGGREPAPITVVQNISTPDVQSFKRSRAQLGADAHRMVAMGRRTS
ncbi:phage tail tape measure C-terminal domain-containing protein [Tritonibacter mobilis]|uniref:phage tail tape measure C-terminal domain-containing protein n=1 Tax=Tritonibacter mobilis TaxID=379347 RepID=UPI0039A65284